MAKNEINIEVEEETLRVLDYIGEHLNFKTHNQIINMLIGIYFIKKAKEGSQ